MRQAELLVIRQAAGGLEYHPPADLDRMVGEPLVVATEQRNVDGGADPVLPFVVDQQGEQVPVLGVDGVVLILQAAGPAGVAGEQHFLRRSGQLDCPGTHFGEAGADVIG